MRKLSGPAALLLLVLSGAGCEPDAIHGYFTLLPESDRSPGFRTDPGSPICNFLGGGQHGGPTDGLQGTLYYDPVSVANGSARPTWIPSSNQARLADFVPAAGRAVALPDPIFFDQVYVPTQYYTTGLPLSQGALTANGAKLIAWFALDFKGSIKLAAGDLPGYYQFALASDDGSAISIDGKSLISMDRTQPTQLGVSQEAVLFAEGQKRSFELLYFQGPPTELAVTLLWRYLGDSVTADELDEPMVAISQSESECKSRLGGNCPGTFGEAGVFFDPVHHNPPLALQAWKDLTSGQPSANTRGGWKVVAPANFDLGKKNPCY